MSGLPKGWVSTRLAELTENPKQDIVDGPFGSNLKASEYVNEGVPIVRLQNIDRNRFLDKNIRCVTSSKAEELSRHSFQEGDVIITKLGVPVGKACIVPSSLAYGIIVADVVRARIDERRALKEYVAYAVNSPGVVTTINSEVKGSTRPRVNLGHIRSLEIPLPPLNEQRRIVAKLEELLARVEASQQRLAKIPVILKRFRQSILAAACSGRLTADWREGNDIEEWEWSTLSKHDVSVQTGPFGSALHRHDYVSNGVPLINPMHIRDGQIYPNADQSVSPIKLKELTRYMLLPGDVVLGRRGEMGRAAVVRDQGLLCGTGSLILRTTSGRVVPDFLCMQLRSPKTCAYLEDGSVGSTMTNLNQQIVGSLEFPVVSPDEQHEIVCRVEALFKVADQIEGRYQKAKAHVDRLTQSILAKAFRGELVPQDENDEPASVLLERIRADRANVETKPRRKMTTRTPWKTYPKEPEVLLKAAEPAATYAESTIPEAILAAMQPGQEYSRADLAGPLKLSTALWNHGIRQLKDQGLVIQTGEKRGARYRLA